ncbi:carotenoid oxygenase family protein [Cyanobacteria bacterium FACHB-DQ100]|nr:carotenoid oxygenase family protein [Cyanobacteria bacterium FACHB-DQ100]
MVAATRTGFPAPEASYTWNQSVLHTAKGFAPTTLPLLSGAIPAGLRGSLYRNGPARLERGNTRVGHWFDGDGAILRVHFDQTGATGVYRYVETPEFLDEERAGRLMYTGYGMLPPGGLIDRFTKGLKNAANTSVLALNDRLLALWEGGHPYALDLETLQTRSLDNLGGLSDSLPFSAHPKRDPQTGDFYNFGVSFGKDTILNLYRIDANGKLQQQDSHKLDGVPLIHDFVMAGQYLLFFIPPVRVNPLLLLTRLKSFSDSFDWKPEKGTQVLVFDRQTLKLISQGETDPWYQWHFGNACVDRDGNAVVDVIRYADFNTNEYFRQVATGKTQTSARSTLWQIRVNPLTGKVLEQQELLDRHCEFPVVKPVEVGQSWQQTYLSLHRRNADAAKEILGVIARFDQKTGALVEADCGENCYPMEPIYAPDAIDANQGWIITVVYDGNRDQSEVWVFDSDRLNDQPVCRLGLPEVIPIGFHGTWKSAT